MRPFRRKSSSEMDDLDDYALDTLVARNNLLAPRPSSDETKLVHRALSAAVGGGGAMPKMLKATSMLEMNVIHDMVQFGEEMDALSGEELSGDDLDDDEGFFIDSSDDILAEDVKRGPFSGLSSSPDSVADSLIQAASVPKPMAVGGMRRVMSVASLSSASQRQKFNLSALQNIQEEDDTLKNNSRASPREQLVPVKFEPSDKKPPNLGDSTHSDSTPTRRSSFHRQPSGGMPKRSSMKGSSNSLRSSLKSCNSSVSGSNLDDTTHSIESNVSVSNPMKRNVSFSSLEIRSYNVTLGDAPTSYGPPVSLDWDYDPSVTQEHQIDSYEDYRIREPRRNRREMLMPANHRHYLLMREAGFTRGEISLAMEEAKRVAKNREKTVKGVKMGLQPVEEVLERTRKTLFGRLKSGSSGGRRKK